MIIIVLIAGDAADGGLHPEFLFDRAHRRHDHRVVGCEHIVDEKGRLARVERGVLLQRTARIDRDHPYESLVIGVDHVGAYRRLDLIGGSAIGEGEIPLIEEIGEVRRRL